METRRAEGPAPPERQGGRHQEPVRPGRLQEGPQAHTRAPERDDERVRQVWRRQEGRHPRPPHRRRRRDSLQGVRAERPLRPDHEQAAFRGQAADCRVVGREDQVPD